MAVLDSLSVTLVLQAASVDDLSAPQDLLQMLIYLDIGIASIYQRQLFFIRTDAGMFYEKTYIPFDTNVATFPWISKHGTFSRLDRYICRKFKAPIVLLFCNGRLADRSCLH
jgi:hypothetical protein